jgi:UDP-N-acetylmuramoyl-tripeptide--D-alanyl-D-alanine ligase
MKTLDLDTIVRVTDGKKFSELETNFSGVATDTRKDMKGQIFIALKGESFDAHDFCVQAVKQGAAALLIHRLPAELQELRNKVTVIVVKDTLKALQQIAHFSRHQSQASFVAITGSNGKTTSKEFCAAVLGASKKVHYSKGSFNNHWGVPFSILAEPAGTEVTILEMGMNHAGEIKQLCEIADPDIVVCTVVGHAHIENFGTIDAIAAAKEEVYSAAPARARRIYNLDNPWTMKMYLKARAQYPMADRLLSFSQLNPKADIYLQIEEMSMETLKVTGKIMGKEGKAEIPVFGSQNLTNIMVAASVAIAVGLSAEEVWTALPRCKTNWGRNQILKSKSGAKILFDGYNANPDSVSALLDNVPLLKANSKIGVFGEMLELGALASQSHLEIGEKVGKSGLDLIWFYGDHASDFEAGVKASGFLKKLIVSKSYDEAIAKQVASQFSAGDIAIVKGSRGMKLERFVVLCEPVDFSVQKE